MEHCAVTSDLNRYMLEQDRALEAADYFEDRIAERTEELMEFCGPCYPFSEATLDDMLESASVRDVLELLARKQYQDASELLHTRLTEYAERAARVLAESQLEQEEF